MTCHASCHESCLLQEQDFLSVSVTAACACGASKSVRVDLSGYESVCEYTACTGSVAGHFNRLMYLTGNINLYHQPPTRATSCSLICICVRVYARLCRDDALVKALSAIGMPVAVGPAAVHRILLQRAGSQAALLSPSYLRDFIQAHAAQAESSVRAERGHAAALLSYCLQDIDDSDADSCWALRGEEPWHPGMWVSR